MAKRIVSGVVGVALVVGVLLFNQTCPIVFNIVIALVCVLATHEVFAAMGIYKFFGILIPTLLFSAVLPLFGYEVFEYAWYVYTVFLFTTMIFMHKVLSFKDIAVLYSMTMLITVALSCTVTLRDFGGENGTFYVIIALGVAWLSDTGAYFTGSFFGKHKLCPEISPKKTVEGAVGGFVVSMAGICLVAFGFQLWSLPESVLVSYWHLLLIAFLGSALSILGDLSFSLMKRGCHIKDFGNVIPGHGGILDRFDSVVFVAPFVCYAIRFLPVLV